MQTDIYEKDVFFSMDDKINMDYDDINNDMEQNAYAFEPDTEVQEQKQEQEIKSNKISTCFKALRLVVQWDRLFGFFCLTGKIRFSAQQYEIVRLAMLELKSLFKP